MSRDMLPPIRIANVEPLRPEDSAAQRDLALTLMSRDLQRRIDARFDLLTAWIRKRYDNAAAVIDRAERLDRRLAEMGMSIAATDAARAVEAFGAIGLRIPDQNEKDADASTDPWEA